VNVLIFVFWITNVWFPRSASLSTSAIRIVNHVTVILSYLQRLSYSITTNSKQVFLLGQTSDLHLARTQKNTNVIIHDRRRKGNECFMTQKTWPNRLDDITPKSSFSPQVKSVFPRKKNTNSEKERVLVSPARPAQHWYRTVLQQDSNTRVCRGGTRRCQGWRSPPPPALCGCVCAFSFWSMDVTCISIFRLLRSKLPYIHRHYFLQRSSCLRPEYGRRWGNGARYCCSGRCQSTT